MESKLDKPFDLHDGTLIRTFTGRHVDVFNPDPDEINLVDIAHGLSNTCRFGGQCRQFYSVAQHSINVALLIPEAERTPQMILTALLHDASEAFMCDIPRPIKRELTGYKQVEENLMRVISEKFGLIYPKPPIIKFADQKVLEIEHRNLMLVPEPDALPFGGYSPQMAKDEIIRLVKMHLPIETEDDFVIHCYHKNHIVNYPVKATTLYEANAKVSKWLMESGIGIPFREYKIRVTKHERRF